MVLGVDAIRLTGLRVGVGRYYEGLVRAWGRQELAFERVTLFSPMPIDDLPCGDSPNGPIRVEVLPARGPGVWWQFSRLRRQASRIGVLLAPYALPPGYRGKAVVSNHGILEGPNRVPGLRALTNSRYHRSSALRATAVIANTTATKADLVRFYGIPEQKITVIWPAIDEAFRPAKSGEDQLIVQTAQRVLGAVDPYFLFVGKLSLRRHIPELLEAFTRATATPSARRFRLLLAGPNTAGTPIGRIASDLGVADRVRHLDFVELDTLALLYRGARALLMPTSKEAFSRPIAEAMASGCPAMALRDVVVGVPEYVAQATGRSAEGAILRADDGSVASLQPAIERLAEDDQLCAQLRERGLECAASFASPDEQARRVMEVLAAVARD
jgi:glycosyltransferase involved in cell wall biosynthesis